MHYLRAAAVLALSLTAACQDSGVSPSTPLPEDQAIGFGFPDAAPSRIGYMRAPDGSVVQVSYEVRPAGHFIHGDILVKPGEIFESEAEALARAPVPGGAQRGMVNPYESAHWPNNLVPYAIAPGYPYTRDIESAIEHIQQVTGVRFVRRTTERDYVYVIAGDGCYSSLGRVGGRQTLSVGTSCPEPRRGVAIHEFGHAIGMHHEHQRCDRDSFIRVNYENISRDRWSSFSKICSSSARILFDYNEGSIMHYPAWRGSVNGEPTMTSFRGREMGQLDSLSTLDRQTIAWMYPAPDGPTPGGCTITGTAYNGQLSGSGAYEAQPNGRYYYSASSGDHVGCMQGPSGSNFDLYLQRWSGSGWQTVARATSTTSLENIRYSGTTGYYRWIAYSRAGSGAYALTVQHP